MKSFARKILNEAGYDLVRLANSNYTLASNLLNVMKARKIGCMLDVGANSGQYGTFLRKIGYDGHILSFEPVSHVFEKLQSVARGDAKWRCFQYALGDKEERRTMNVYKSTVFSSFLEANEYSKTIWSSLNDSRPEEVTVRKLENVYSELVRDIGGSSCMLKMDTQGYDANVFRGALGVLEHIEALQSEISLINVYEGMPDGLEVLKLFRDHGYHVSGMFAVNREESLAAIEFDCVLVKRGPIRKVM